MRTSFYLHHVEAISSDGVHFTTSGTLTTNGLDAGSQTWGDMAYDPQTGYWYAALIPLYAIRRPQEGYWSGASTASSCTGSRTHPF